MSSPRSVKDMGVNPTKSILVTFVVMILSGAVLLMLPASTANGEYCDLLTALFTATSATCVTGLTVVDTLSYWSRFGQTVILLLVQCGGIGFIAFAVSFTLAARRRSTLRQRVVMSYAVAPDSMHNIAELTKSIILRSFLCEGVGAVLLAIRFIPRFGIGEGIYMSVFHSVSAFCNAGIDVISADGASLAEYAADPLVCLTVAFLSIVGGLGFFVWEDLHTGKRFRRFSLHTKLVLVTSGILLVTGTVLFLLFEYTNPYSLGDMSIPQKLLAAFFGSTMARSAGFCTISTNSFTSFSKLVTAILMFIGGSPGSTAGGVKTATFAVLVLAGASALRGRNEVEVFGRRISSPTVYRCIAVTMGGAILVLASAVVVACTNAVSGADSVFECIAAFSTAGISSGITPMLNDASKLLIMLLMYFGRVGFLTVGLSLFDSDMPSKLRYPDEKIIIG